jgi:hypothetical protein
MTSPAAGGDRVVHDLIASWEAWREPGQDFSVLTGMDPTAYRLGLRLYAGPQRFLEDALGGRDWFCTPLQLPGGTEGLTEVLKVTLALGDGVARNTLTEIFAKSEQDWLDDLPAGTDRGELQRQWQELRSLTSPRMVAKDPRINLSPDERTYQTVLRSCATMAYYGVTVAVDRLASRGLGDGVRLENLDEVRLSGDEPWMGAVANTNLGGLLIRAPRALRWLRANPQALPDKIPGRLDKAGLVMRERGKPISIHYSLQQTTPYGALADNLIR